MNLNSSKSSVNRRLVMAKDLNGANKLFGGTILAWIDEQAYIEVLTFLKSTNIVTKFISEVNFISGATVGNVVEIKTIFTKTGTTSVTLRVEVFNFSTQKTIANVNEIVMINVDQEGKPTPHHCTLEN